MSSVDCAGRQTPDFARLKAALVHPAKNIFPGLALMARGAVDIAQCQPQGDDFIRRNAIGNTLDFLRGLGFHVHVANGNHGLEG